MSESTTPDLPQVSLESRVAALEYNAVLSGAVVSALLGSYVTSNADPEDAAVLDALRTRLRASTAIIHAQVDLAGILDDFGELDRERPVE